jgi:hypothetical protein
MERTMSDVQTDPQVTDNTPAPDAAPAAPAAPDTSWVPRRISEITAARRAAEQRAAEAEAEAARLREQLAAAARPAGDPVTPPVHGAVPSQADFDRLVQARAEALANQRSQESSLNQRIGEINAAGAKEYGEDFEKATQNLSMAGIGGPEFLKVLTNVPKAEAVVTWLGKTENLNEAMRIASLDPIAMGIELTKMSTKAAKELGKQISKAPPPIDPITGNSAAADDAEPDPKDMKAWMAWRQKHRKSRR